MLYNELMSDLTFTLPKGGASLIKINGSNATCVLSVQIETGAVYTVQSSVDSTEYVDTVADVSSIFLENIVIEGVPQASLNAEIKSIYFVSPNFIYITNTSPNEESIKVSLRGNK